MAVVDTHEQRLPTAEHEAHFWAHLETAWAPLGPEVNQARRALASRAPDPEVAISIIDKALNTVLENLTNDCRELSSDELTDLDRVLERKLYDIDRADVQAVTDGSDDGFLYSRGFIVLRRPAPRAVRGLPAHRIGHLPGVMLEPDRLARLTRPGEELGPGAVIHVVQLVVGGFPPCSSAPTMLAALAAAA